MEKLKLSVGDKLYIVKEDVTGSARKRIEGYSTVLKVGTKFFYIDMAGVDEKVPLTITFPHHFNQYVTIYLTKEDWEERDFRDRFHWKLSGALSRREFKDVPLEKLKEVVEILGLWQA